MMMLVVMVLVVMVPPPPGLVVMLMVMVVMMAASGGRLQGTGDRASGEEDGDQARSKSALQHDDLLNPWSRRPFASGDQSSRCGERFEGFSE
ncbi:hypothetical protein X748_13315 [Mesorhizobium sp. LNJC386A00]|nr:hypothetical protein X752_15930 [Mesorhizobium sp. LNJC398B00]ESY36627.1 hypothetical protein X748_13315 [Mesorhizobium sp. LNJC386A00]